MLITGRRSHVE
jgi:hypothetical protein